MRVAARRISATAETLPVGMLSMSKHTRRGHPCAIDTERGHPCAIDPHFRPPVHDPVDYFLSLFSRSPLFDTSKGVRCLLLLCCSTFKLLSSSIRGGTPALAIPSGVPFFSSHFCLVVRRFKVCILTGWILRRTIVRNSTNNE